MKIYTRKTKSELFDENNELLTTNISEVYIIYPDKNKQLKNMHTGEILCRYACIQDKAKLADFVEIDAR